MSTFLSQYRDELILVVLVVFVVVAAWMIRTASVGRRVKTFKAAASELGWRYSRRVKEDRPLTVWQMLKSDGKAIRLHVFTGIVEHRSFMIYETVDGRQTIYTWLRRIDRKTTLEIEQGNDAEVLVYRKGSLVAWAARGALARAEVALPDPDFNYKFLVVSHDPNAAAALLGRSMRQAITNFDLGGRKANWSFGRDRIRASWQRRLQRQDVVDAGLLMRQVLAALPSPRSV